MPRCKCGCLCHCASCYFLFSIHSNCLYLDLHIFLFSFRILRFFSSRHFYFLLLLLLLLLLPLYFIVHSTPHHHHSLRCFSVQKISLHCCAGFLRSLFAKQQRRDWRWNRSRFRIKRRTTIVEARLIQTIYTDERWEKKRVTHTWHTRNQKKKNNSTTSDRTMIKSKSTKVVTSARAHTHDARYTKIIF